eukprot:COSAG06_NODE_542_length_14469_cov_39.223591_1_plen_127_part_00
MITNCKGATQLQELLGGSHGTASQAFCDTVDTRTPTERSEPTRSDDAFFVEHGVLSSSWDSLLASSCVPSASFGGGGGGGGGGGLAASSASQRRTAGGHLIGTGAKGEARVHDELRDGDGALKNHA